MNMSIRFFLGLLGMVLLFACESEPSYQDVTGEPEVFFRGTVGGEFHDWEAGVSNFYNYTYVETNEFDFHNLHSKLSQIDSMSPTLEVILLDSDEIGENLSDDERFETGNRSYLRQSDAIKSYTIRLESSQLSDYLFNFEWLTGQGALQSASPELTFDSAGSELICLKGETLDGDIIHTCKRINLDQNKDFTPLLRVSNVTTDSVTVVAEMPDVQCDRWDWNGYLIEDYSFSMAKENWSEDLVHLKMYNSSVLLSDILFTGELNSSNEPIIGQAGFTYELLERKVKDRFQHGKVIINYEHPQNGLYSSKFAENSDQEFQILEMEPFEMNEAGIKTVLLTLSFEAVLKTEFGHEMTVNSNAVKMAFPIPES